MPINKHLLASQSVYGHGDPAGYVWILSELLIEFLEPGQNGLPPADTQNIYDTYIWNADKDWRKRKADGLDISKVAEKEITTLINAAIQAQDRARMNARGLAYDESQAEKVKPPPLGLLARVKAKITQYFSGGGGGSSYKYKSRNMRKSRKMRKMRKSRKSCRKGRK